MLSQHLLIASLAVALIAVMLPVAGGRLKASLVAIGVLAVGLMTVLFAVADWFTGEGVNEAVIYHLKTGIGGAGLSDYRLLILGASAGIIVSLVLAVIVARRVTRQQRQSRNAMILLQMGLLLISIAVHPALQGWLEVLEARRQGEVAATEYPFERYYRTPLVSYRPQQPPHLVVLFLESVERSYFDESVFPDLVPGLKSLEDEAVSFTQVEQLPGTAWTIGGLTAGLCGLPLFTPSHGNSMAGMDEFLAGATCLGDLVGNDYQLTYLSGTSTEFAGTRKLFTSHGFDSVIGLENMENPDLQHDAQGWGLTDDQVFEQAWSMFLDLADNAQPTGLFVSSMDTHPPDGRVAPGCGQRVYRNGENPMLNAVHCTDYLTSQFVERIRTSKHGENTVIVVVSDHLSMPNAAASLLQSTQRSNLFMLLGPGLQPGSKDRPASPLDIAPTILTALGYRAQMALGRDLLSGERSVSELIPQLETVIAGWFEPIGQFWRFPELAPDDLINIDVTSGVVRAGGMNFALPLLLELGKDGEVTVRFDSDNPGFQLADFVARMDARQPFLWVDQCHTLGRSIGQSNTSLGGEFCFAYGASASQALVRGKLPGELSITRREIESSLQSVAARRSATTVRDQAQDPDRIIAHAGGQVNGRNYTNSLEALNQSFAKGFRLFELDFAKTSDDHWVAVHDWNFWQSLTGYAGDIPPTREEFLAQPMLGELTPLDLQRINSWFSQHPEAVLVTDKVNEPLAFSQAFIAPERLVMELFSLEALQQAIASTSVTAMASENVISSLGEQAPRQLAALGVQRAAVSRHWVNTRAKPLAALRDANIKVYLYHINRYPSRDETFAVCSDLDFVYGLYADNYDFRRPAECSHQ